MSQVWCLLHLILQDLENSFEDLGRTMIDVFTLQQQTNELLQDQVRRANETQQEQTLAMQDLADITEQ